MSISGHVLVLEIVEAQAPILRPARAESAGFYPVPERKLISNYYSGGWGTQEIKSRNSIGSEFKKKSKIVGQLDRELFFGRR